MEYNSGSPIYLQVINELKKKMVKGELKPGEKMPSNREEYMFDNVKKEMAEELLKNFVHEMRDLGFQKGEIIEQIADYEEEQK